MRPAGLSPRNFSGSFRLSGLSRKPMPGRLPSASGACGFGVPRARRYDIATSLPGTNLMDQGTRKMPDDEKAGPRQPHWVPPVEEARVAREERRLAMQAEDRERAREERKQEQSALASERHAQSRAADRRHALLAAATSLGPGTSPGQLYERANELLVWIRADS